MCAIFQTNSFGLNSYSENIAGSNSFTSALCTFSVIPDLPLIASTAEIENEINLIVSRYSDDYLGTSAPSASSLSSAESDYAALGITVNNGVITGNNIANLSTLSFLKTFARHLKFNPTDTNIATKANNAVWWASQEICDGNLDVDVRGYDYRNFGRPTILLKDFLTQTVKDLFAYTLYKTTENFLHYWVANYDEAHQIANDAIDTDQMYTKSDILMVYSIWQDSPEERYRYMRGFKRYMDRFFTYSVGTTNGIKPDGTSFHHWAAYNNYMYSFNTASNNVYLLRDTRFQVESGSYKLFRDAILIHMLQANDFGIQALSTCGRKPDSRETTVSLEKISNLSIAGGEILGLSTADPILAGYINRVDGINPSFNYNTITPFEEGFIQINHANAGFLRENNWVAFAKGFSNGLWGTETYISSNRYGRYQSYGALEIIYPGNKLSGNGYDVNTWNWNYSPGTTVIRLPWDKLHAERARIDERQIKNFAGSLTFRKKQNDFLVETYGDFGMFAMDFQEMEDQGFSTVYSSNNHNGTFTFKKSYFLFDDIIICLGSGISNNDSSNNTITTLFQRVDNKGISPNVNGTSQSSLGEVSFDGNSNNWLLSNYNTGFYLISGNYNLKIKKELQQVPYHTQIWPANIGSNQIQTYYTGYLDHGLSPNNKNYEYIVLPNSDATKMLQLDLAIAGGNKPYTVHQQDANAHIVEHKAKNIFAYAVFNNLNNISFENIKTINNSCLVMTENDVDNNNLRLAVSNPDLGIESRSYQPVTDKLIDITLHGEWNLIESNPNVQLISSNSTETILQFNTKNGLSLEVQLSSSLSNSDFKKKEIIKLFPNPSKGILNISSKEPINSVEIFDLTGRKVYNSYKDENRTNWQININNLRNALYLIKIQTNLGTTTKQLIINK